MMWDMPRDAADLLRLAEHVTARRSALQISVDEAARRANMSNNTWHRVEDGKGVRDTTYHRVEKVLSWPAGTCAQVIADPGFKPFESVEALGAAYSSGMSEEAVRQAIQNATLATAPGLTGAQILELQQRAIDELKRQGLLDQ